MGLFDFFSNDKTRKNNLKCTLCHGTGVCNGEPCYCCDEKGYTVEIEIYKTCKYCLGEGTGGKLDLGNGCTKCNGTGKAWFKEYE